MTTTNHKASSKTTQLLGLRVVVIPDEEFWFAQGLELDYGTQGDTIDDAIAHFEQGLRATITMHLERFGNIDGVNKATPGPIIREMLPNGPVDLKFIGQVPAHKIHEALPFDRINYLTPAAKAEAVRE